MRWLIPVTALLAPLLVGCGGGDAQSDAQRDRIVGTWTRPIPLGIGGTEEVIEFRADGTVVTRSAGTEKTASWRVEKGKLIVGKNAPQTIRTLNATTLGFGDGEVVIELTRQTAAGAPAKAGP